jgi:hypothetical protein
MFAPVVLVHESVTLPTGYQIAVGKEGEGIRDSEPARDAGVDRALAGRLATRPGDAEFTRGLEGVIAGFAGSARKSR